MEGFVLRKGTPKGYWTKARCAEAAAEFGTRTAFVKGSQSAYNKAWKEGWLDDICEHMQNGRVGPRKWTKEKVAAEAAKYSTRADFRKFSGAARGIAARNGWMDEVCAHMELMIKPVGYWTKERCVDAANQCETRMEFHDTYQSAYSAAQRDGFLEELCAHMPESARESQLFWTKDKVQAEALRYETRSVFFKGSQGAYSAAQRYEWLDEVCGHMAEIKKPNGYWTKERCIAEARKYDSRANFNEYAGGAAVSAQRNGWMDEVCAHIPLLIKPKNYWTKERLIETAAQYTSRTEFNIYDQSAYQSAQAKGWLDDVCEHMGETSGGFDPTKPGRLYYLRIESDTGPLYKIGVTNATVMVRFSRKDQKRITRLRYWQFENGGEARTIEQQILRHCRAYRYGGPAVLSSGGNSELFTRDVLGIDADGHERQE